MQTMSEKVITSSQDVSSANALGISECVTEDKISTAADKSVNRTFEDYDCENIPVDDDGSLPSRPKWDTILLMSALSVSQNK
jgi:hypothetical protein